MSKTADTLLVAIDDGYAQTKVYGQPASGKEPVRAVFRTSGAYPAALQATWAATATEWFPSNPWRLRPGPSIVAVLDRAEDFSTATTELWLPIERS